MCGLCILSVSCTGEELNERVEVLGQRWTSLSPKNWFSFFIQRCQTNIAILAVIKTIVAVGAETTGWYCRSGRWVRCAECLPALLTFLSRPIENPQALKTLSVHCFHWLRPYLNTLHHSHTPWTQRQLKVLQKILELLGFVFIHFVF